MQTDIPLKRLTQRRPADLLPLLGAPTAEVVRVEALELPASATSLDTVLRLRQRGGEEYLHLVEWQGYRDDLFLWRVLGYLSWLGQNYAERPILATLIYLKPGDDVGGMLHQQLHGAGDWTASLSCVRLWEQDAAAALAFGAPGLLALLPLMRGATDTMVEGAARMIIAQIDDATVQSELLVNLGVFAAPLMSAERFLRLVTKERLMATDLISLLVQDAVDEKTAALDEKTAALEQENAVLQHALHAAVEDAVLLRFPAIDAALVAQIGLVTVPVRLQQLLAAVLRAGDQAEVERLLTELGDSRDAR